MSQTWPFWPWQWPFRCHHSGEASCADRGKTRIGGHFDRKSLLISFIFYIKNGWRWQFWMTENHFRSHFSTYQINNKFGFFHQYFRSHFSPFHINTQFFFHKMAAGGHFGWPSFRSHFSPFQINTQFWFFFPQNGCRWPFWMTENHFRLHFSPFQINTQHFFH